MKVKSANGLGLSPGAARDHAPDAEPRPACCAPAATALGMPLPAPAAPRLDFPVPRRTREEIVKGMVAVPAGAFLMGGDDPDAVRGTHEGLRLGKLEIVLEGRRLRGAWVLVRTGKRGSKPQWLLIKQRDRSAGNGAEPVERFARSVVSRRTMAGIAEHAEQTGKRWEQ